MRWTDRPEEGRAKDYRIPVDSWRFSRAARRCQVQRRLLGAAHRWSRYSQVFNWRPRVISRLPPWSDAYHPHPVSVIASPRPRALRPRLSWPHREAARQL